MGVKHACMKLQQQLASVAHYRRGYVLTCDGIRKS